MHSKMRISAILIKNYRQFRNFRLDLIDPSTGQPLDKVCFIGANGTGKSTLLALIAQFLQTGQVSPLRHNFSISPVNGISHLELYTPPKGQLSLLCLKISSESDGEHYFIHIPSVGNFLSPAAIDKTDEWSALWEQEANLATTGSLSNFLAEKSQNHLLENFRLQSR